MEASGASAVPDAREWESIAASCGWAPRELEAVRYILTGMPRKAAATEMGISLSSLQTYLRRAMWKVDAEDLVALFWAVVSVRDRLRADASGA